MSALHAFIPVTRVPLSTSFRTKAIYACVNFDITMELTLSRSRDHKWKIPVLKGPIYWGTSLEAYLHELKEFAIQTHSV